jgi:subfamily B ATP-binding cassette protein MsbA
VGTGLVQLVGSLVTAAFAFAVLCYLNWRLTLITLAVLVAFAVAMAVFFRRLRPLFRERGKINADVTGRLGEALGGIRIVKVYTAEKREDLVFARGAHRLLRNVAGTITAISGVGAVSTLILGLVGVLMLLIGGRAVIAGTMTSFTDFTGSVGCTTRMFAVSVAVVIGVKSVTLDATLSRMNGSSHSVCPVKSSV